MASTLGIFKKSRQKGASLAFLKRRESGADRDRSGYKQICRNRNKLKESRELGANRNRLGWPLSGDPNRGLRLHKLNLWELDVTKDSKERCRRSACSWLRCLKILEWWVGLLPGFSQIDVWVHCVLAMICGWDLLFLCAVKLSYRFSLLSSPNRAMQVCDAMCFCSPRCESRDIRALDGTETSDLCSAMCIAETTFAMRCMFTAICTLTAEIYCDVGHNGSIAARAMPGSRQTSFASSKQACFIGLSIGTSWF